jgi:asparaginyl-tRNA synthetase
MNKYVYPIASFSKLKFNQKQTIKGFIKSIRNQKNISFLQLNDGLLDLQTVVSSELLPKSLQIGATVECQGVVVPCSGKQSKEFQIETVKVLGSCHLFPFQKRVSMDTVREHVHLRARTNMFQSIWKVRDELFRSTRSFLSVICC